MYIHRPATPIGTSMTIAAAPRQWEITRARPSALARTKPVLAPAVERTGYWVGEFPAELRDLGRAPNSPGRSEYSDAMDEIVIV